MLYARSKMGCDYYTQQYYLFTYTSSEGKEETYEEPAGVRESWYIGNYDSDVDTHASAMNKHIELLGFDKTLTLYTNGNWSCTESCKERLQAIMGRHLDKPVTQIVKYTVILDR